VAGECKPVAPADPIKTSPRRSTAAAKNDRQDPIPKDRILPT
jgi:hypothetical protein